MQAKNISIFVVILKEILRAQESEDKVHMILCGSVTVLRMLVC